MLFHDFMGGFFFPGGIYLGISTITIQEVYNTVGDSPSTIGTNHGCIKSKQLGGQSISFPPVYMFVC